MGTAHAFQLLPNVNVVFEKFHGGIILDIILYYLLKKIHFNSQQLTSEMFRLKCLKSQDLSNLCKDFSVNLQSFKIRHFTHEVLRMDSLPGTLRYL